MHFWIVRPLPEEREREREREREIWREWLASGFLIVRVDESVKRNGSRGGVRVLMKFKHGPAKRINYSSTPSVSGLVAVLSRKTVGALQLSHASPMRRLSS